MPTLAQIQTENEKLKAHKERTAYQAALAQTLETAPLLEQGGPLMHALQAHLNAMFDRWLDEAGEDQSEIQIHHTLSDIAHDTLRDLGRDLADRITPQKVGASLQAGARPRDLLTVSQWADRYRVLKTETNAPGPWQTDRTPYLREIQDALSEHSPVRTVTFVKASGVGGTEVMYNWIGYVVHHLGNKNLLLAVPTLELRNRSLNPRLRKLFRESPALSHLISDKTRDRTNRDDVLEYGADAKIIKAGANSPDPMRSEHLPYAALDEIDAYPWDVRGEGDPLELFGNRQATYTRAKTYQVSTPTLKNESHIDTSYQASDRRRYHVPCPHCDHLHPFEFANFRYRLVPDADPNDPAAEIRAAWMVCPACQGQIHERDKQALIASGRWIAQNPGVTRHRGYHINSFYAPVGLGLRWAEIAAQWHRAQNDTSRLKTFINTRLGEVWTEQGESIEDIPLITRLESVDPRDLQILLTTAGVDVQQDRLEVTNVLWAAGEEAWALDHVIIPGDTLTAEPWDQLEPLLRGYGVQFVAVDAGYNTGMVQTWVQPRAWAFATKGMSGLSRPLIEDERKRRQRLRYRRKKGAPVEPIGVDEGKALVYSRIKRETPGPGYIHWIDGPAFDDEYFAQIASEKLVRKRRRGRDLHEWVATRPRNEALDCLILALVALRLSGRSVDPAPKAEPKPAAPGPMPSEAPTERDPFSPIPFSES